MSKDRLDKPSKVKKSTQVSAAPTKTGKETSDLTDETLEKVSGGCRKAGGEQEYY